MVRSSIKAARERLIAFANSPEFLSVYSTEYKDGYLDTILSIPPCGTDDAEQLLASLRADMENEPMEHYYHQGQEEAIEDFREELFEEVEPEA